MINIDISLSTTVIDSAPLFLTVNNFFVILMFVVYNVFKMARSRSSVRGLLRQGKEKK
jgi:hypothetical protein